MHVWCFSLGEAQGSLQQGAIGMGTNAIIRCAHTVALRRPAHDSPSVAWQWFSTSAVRLVAT
eukprot:2142579-Amphidinium_carterae.2